MPSLARKRFFVYELSMDRPGKYVFYVGKGSGKRPNSHVSEADRGTLSLKCGVIRYLFQHRLTYWIRVIYETDNEQEAYWHEMKTITAYPVGVLCNVFASFRPPTYRIEIVPEKHHYWYGKLIDTSTDTVVTGTTYPKPEQVRAELVQEYDHIVVPPYFRSVNYPHYDRHGNWYIP